MPLVQSPQVPQNPTPILQVTTLRFAEVHPHPEPVAGDRQAGLSVPGPTALESQGVLPPKAETGMGRRYLLFDSVPVLLRMTRLA